MTCLSIIMIVQVFRTAYCIPFRPEDYSNCTDTVQELVEAAKAVSPLLLNKVKFHLLLHLPESLRQFGPTSAYNTVRYISFCYCDNILNKIGYIHALTTELFECMLECNLATKADIEKRIRGSLDN